MKYLVNCDRFDHLGRGICHVNGKIVFVDNFLVGEKAYIRIIKEKKKYCIGELVSLESKSLYRVSSKCPYDKCGCALKNLRYDKQLQFKEEKIKNILLKYGHIETKVNEIIPSDNVYGYRNKITLKVNGSVGYCQNRSNKIINIVRCELVSEKMNNVITILNDMDLSKVEEVIIKEFDGIMVIIKGYLDFSKLISVADSIYVNNKLVYGRDFIETRIGDLTFKISKDSFFQVNTQIIKKLYDQILYYCGSNYDMKVLDLYCGTGTITLLLSKLFKEVIGIEINKEAILCANNNKKINNIENVNFMCGDASKLIQRMSADIVVVDPPRNGLTKESIDNILMIKPEKIIYVSCDPMTLVRDLNVLKERYYIKEVTPLDMFPNTYHVECVCLLERHLALIK